MLLGFEPGEVFNQLLLSLLILSLLHVELLKVNNFLSATKTLILLKLSNLLLTSESLIEHNLIALLFNSELILTENFLCLIVADELKVSFNFEDMLLPLHFSLLLIFSLPLLLEHMAFNISELTLLHLCLNTSILLPFKNGLGIVNSLFLFLHFTALTLLLGSQIKFPELSVDMLLSDLLINGPLFVHKLLFALQLTLLDEEFALLLSQVISGVLESLLKSAVDLINSLFLTSLLKLVKPNSHLFSDLLGGFKVGHELLFVNTVLGIKKGLESILY